MWRKTVAGLIVAGVFAFAAAAALIPARMGPAAEGRIALIHVEGVIMGGRGQTTLLSESGGTDTLIRQLHAARDDKSVRVIVLRINSPGGSVPATQEIGEEMKKIRAGGKPIIASMGDIAASGGYWLAAMSDRVYANPSTLTGSIGVYMPYANWEELYRKIGIRAEKIKSGPHKDILSPDRPLTEAERAIIQQMVDEMYEEFVTVVAEGRKIDPDRVRQLADGRIYTGRQARELGLVDDLGNLYDAIDGAAALAGIGGKPEVKEYGRSGPWSLLFGPSERLEIENLLLRRMGGGLPVTAPLAIPDGWKVE